MSLLPVNIPAHLFIFSLHRPSQTGLYRVSGEGRTVKELKERFLRGRWVPALAKVDDIHCVTGLLKDFLRNLPEPLLTFRLNRAFMVAAGPSLAVGCLFKGLNRF